MILWLQPCGNRPNKQMARLVSFVHRDDKDGRPRIPRIRVQFQGDGKYAVRKLSDVCGVEIGRGVDIHFVPRSYHWDRDAYVPKGS